MADKIEYFPHEVTDEDVYNLVVRHSGILDRMNPRKMLQMSISAYNALCDVTTCEEDAMWSAWIFHDEYLDSQNKGRE